MSCLACRKTKEICFTVQYFLAIMEIVYHVSCKTSVLKGANGTQVECRVLGYHKLFMEPEKCWWGMGWVGVGGLVTCNELLSKPERVKKFLLAS